MLTGVFAARCYQCTLRFHSKATSTVTALASVRAGVIALTVAACGGSPAPAPAPQVPTQIAVVKAPVRTPIGKRWHYHPTLPPTWADGHRRDDGRWLLVDETGDRWLSSPIAEGASTTTAVRLKASPFHAPRPLARVAVQNQKWRFFDDVGNLYESDEAMGPLRLIARAPAKLRTFTLWSQGALGVDDAGKGYRFTTDRWTPTPPFRRWPFAVEANKQGQLIALSAPEQLSTSTDGGQTWTVVPATTFGANALHLNARGHVAVTGAKEVREWNGDTLTKATAPPTRALPRIDLRHMQLAPGPSFLAMADNVATLTESKYYEVITSADGETTPWKLRRGPLGGPYTTDPLPIREPCSMGIQAAGDMVLIACSRPAEERTNITLHRSTDGGDTFSLHAKLWSQTPDVTFTVNRQGAAFAIGACPVNAGKTSNSCKSNAITWIETNGKAQLSTIADLDSDIAPATLATFSFSGKQAYFVAGSGKLDAPALFVARKTNHHFLARKLRGVGRDEDDDEQANTASALHPGEDGSLGITLDGRRPQYLLASANGRVLQTAKLPAGALAVAGAGRLVLAAGTHHDNGTKSELALWESRDGGQHFTPVHVPIRRNLFELGEGVRPYCSRAGCFLGDVLTRVGWEASADGGIPLMRIEETAGALIPELRTPIVCQVGEDKPWQQLADVASHEVPDISVAARGTSLWSLLRTPADGSVISNSMELTAAGKASLRAVKLLAAPNKTEARHVAGQMEGYAVARVQLPPTGLTNTSRANVEVAWLNFVTGEHGKGIARNMPLAARSVRHESSGAARLNLDLLSVSPSAIFVKTSTSASDTVVLSTDGRELLREAHPGFARLRANRRNDDATLVNGTAIAIGNYDVSGASAALLSTNPFAGSAGFMMLLPPLRRSPILPLWTYRNGRVGVAIQAYSDNGQQGVAHFMPFTASGLGPIVQAPTTLDIKEATPCSAAMRQNTARIRAPYMPGKRRPILIQGDEQITMISHSSVLHGTPDKPCVAAWSARPTSDFRGRSVQALIALGSTPSFLFRHEPGRRMSYRTMSCQNAPGATVPDIYLRQPGVLRQR